MNIQFNIKIHILPEKIKEKDMYFWCLEKNSNGQESSCGHGWSNSIQGATEDAYAFYLKAFKSED